MEFIYVRTNKLYKINSSTTLIKLGKTNNIPDRHSQYITYEPIGGKFIIVLLTKISDDVEKLIQKKFAYYNFYEKGGTEFYINKIQDLIIPFLKSLNIEFKELSEDEIKELTRTDRDRKELKIIPRDYQEKIIQLYTEYLAENDKGLMLLVCGIGKTYISLWVTQRLNRKNILIGVPNLILINQWLDAIKKIFGKCLSIKNISSGIKKILFFPDVKITLSTYSSSYNLINEVYDMKILDECHHLTGKEKDISKGKFKNILKIKSEKQLALTATPKNKEHENVSTIGNNSYEHFGKILVKKSLRWAIDKDIICDYIIQIISHPVFKTDNNLYYSVFSSLKSIESGISHHILIYCNSNKSSNNLYKLFSDKNKDKDIFISEYNSNISESERNIIINNFKKSGRGIIICVYCLGEGWDFPELDAVVFAEKMSSNIRIIQCALRACRKNINQPNKKAKIILPIFNLNEDELNDDYKKIKEVLMQLSYEDTSIISKIVFKNSYSKKIGNNKIKSEEEYICDKEKVLTKLKLIDRQEFIKHISYTKAKNIVQKYNLKSKKEYSEIIKNDLRLSSDPDIFYGEKFKGWMDYLGIDKNNFYNFSDCQNKINYYLNTICKNVLDLDKIRDIICENDKNFPDPYLWLECYSKKSLKELIERKIKRRVFKK